MSTQPMDNEVHFSHEELQSLRYSLEKWWQGNRRRFPWRETGNAFHILLSEILLQRTRANQVVPVYMEIVSRFPTPVKLAAVDRQEVTQVLYSLGLPQRVDTIIEMAQQVMREYSGEVPHNYSDLTSLNGVGDYVASAVCCFALGQAVIVVDTNTVRIIGRVFGVPTNAESRRKKKIREMHEILLDRVFPREYNYALLDLGALVCTPSNPQCDLCPICKYCSYGSTHASHELPT